jgi:TolB-like protein
MMFARLSIVALLLAVVSPTPAKKNVAILYFDNYTGQADYDPLGRGIASMMISDLSVVKEIQLVEREKMQELIKEIDMQRTKYFDSTTSVRVGKLLGAEYVVVGAFAAVDPKMRIDTRVVRVETGEIVKTAQVTGDQDKFFDLQQDLANKLIDGLGIALSPEEKASLEAQQKANRVEALKTVASFSRAIQLYDRKDYEGAAKAIAPAVQQAPNSMLVRVVASDIKRRTTESMTNKAADKLKGLIRRPPF